MILTDCCLFIPVYSHLPVRLHANPFFIDTAQLVLAGDIAPFGSQPEPFPRFFEWAPFVGAFVGRISRGRKISEFVAGVLIVPALGSGLWFAIFGTSALHLELVSQVKIAAEIVKDVSVGAFELYKHYPVGTIMSYGMLLLITTFFVTSANSATYVLAAYCQHGTRPPARAKMAVWGILMGALAVVLLVTGGSNAMLNIQTISLCTAPPFAVIMFFACLGFWKALNSDEQNGRL